MRQRINRADRNKYTTHTRGDGCIDQLSVRNSAIMQLQQPARWDDDEVMHAIQVTKVKCPPWQEVLCGGGGGGLHGLRLYASDTDRKQHNAPDFWKHYSCKKVKLNETLHFTRRDLQK